MLRFSIRHVNAVCWLAAFVALLFTSCSNNNADTTADPERIFGSPYDPANVIEQPQGGGLHPLRFPNDQLIVQTEPDLERDSFLKVIDELQGVALIGQIPRLGLYQLRVDARDRSELDRFKDQLRAHSSIRGVSYNYLSTSRGRSIGRCPVEPDVRSINDPVDRAPYEQTHYFTALEIVEGLRDMLTMESVTVGIVDGGYAIANGEFDDIAIRNVSQDGDNGQPEPLDPRNEHGTCITGIICADNDGHETNGVASTLIGDSLRVAMASPLDNSYFSNFVALARLVKEGHADVINSSWGYGGPFECPAEGAEMLEMFRNLMTEFSEVLFVNAAPNYWIELTGDNDAPAGIMLPNSITVTSWDIDRPDLLAIDCGYGSVVDIAAPGEMPVVAVDGGQRYSEAGTSYSTPMVTSAAALLHALGVRDPHDIKKRLLTATFHEGVVTEPGGGVQLSFAHPLADLLWERYGSRSWAQYAFDGDADGNHDPPEQIAHALCGEANFNTANFGDFRLDPVGHCLQDTAFILMPDGQSWTLQAGGEGVGSETLIWLNVVGNLSETFALNTPYGADETATIVIEICRDSNHDCVCDTDGAEDFRFVGTVSGGWFEFSHCSVSERVGGAPKYLMMDAILGGPVHGTLITYQPLSTSETTTNIFGWLRGLNAIPLPALATYDEQVECACEDESTDS